MRNCNNCGKTIPITALYSSINKNRLTCPYCHTQFYKVRNRKFVIVILLQAFTIASILTLMINLGAGVPGLISTALLLLPIFLTADIIYTDYSQEESQDKLPK